MLEDGVAVAEEKAAVRAPHRRGKTRRRTVASIGAIGGRATGSEKTELLRREGFFFF